MKPLPLHAPPTGRLRPLRPLQAALRDVIRGLPMTSAICPGRQQALATSKIIRGEYEGCGPLDAACDDLIARAQSRDEAELVLLIPEVIRLHLEARIADRFGADDLRDFGAANVAEQRADAIVDALQLEVAHTPTLGLRHKLRTAIVRQMHRLQHLMAANEQQLRAREARHA